MTVKISVDKSGRVVLPKPLRDKLGLRPGDDLLIEDGEDRLTLRPIRPQASLKKELGIWVYQGELSNLSIAQLLDLEREKRLRELAS